MVRDATCDAETATTLLKIVAAEDVVSHATLSSFVVSSCGGKGAA